MRFARWHEYLVKRELASNQKVMSNIMPVVELYTTSFCPYCVRAKMLLDQKKVSYNELKVDEFPELRAQMRERANGGHTVPQIFINEQHIGGCDEMMALEYKGQLDALLKH